MVKRVNCAATDEAKKEVLCCLCVNTFIVTVHVGKKGILASILRLWCFSFPLPAHILLICFFLTQEGGAVFSPLHFTCSFMSAFCMSFPTLAKPEGNSPCIPTLLYNPAISQGLHPRKCSLFDPSVYKQMDQRRNRWEDRMKATG